MKLPLVWLAAAAALAAPAPPPAVCGDPHISKAIWREPKPMTSEDWTCGPGGCANKPVPPFQFLKAGKDGGTTPKMDVRDARGRTWSVKFGAEATPECFASRFLTALGYIAEPTYCLPDTRYEGMPASLPLGLRRARHPDGTFTLARFEMRGQKDLQFLQKCTWAWDSNPFVGTHELAGLKIVMMLLSNWDAKDGSDDTNNGVFLGTQNGMPILLYSMFDWGGSMGHWGGFLRRDRDNCVSFVHDTPKFIKHPGSRPIDWGYSGKSSGDIKAGVGPSDVRWLLPYLGRITPEQLQTGLIASGATPREAACWSSAIQERIRQLRLAAQ